MIADWLMKAISNIVLFHLLSLVGLLSLNLYIFLKSERTLLSRRYFILSAGPFFWLMGKLFKTVAPVLSLRWTGILIQYFGMVLIAPSFFLFCLAFLMKRRNSPETSILLYIPSLVLFILIITNPYHFLFYREFTLYRDSFGPVFYAVTYTIYGGVAAGTALLIAGTVKNEKKIRRQFLLFIAAAFIPLLASRYYPHIGNMFSGMKFDITPVSFNLSFLCFGVAVFRYGFLNIRRIAFGQIVDFLPEGIVVRGRDNSVIFINRAGQGHENHTAPGESGKNNRKINESLDLKNYEINKNDKKNERYSILKIIDKSELCLRRRLIESGTMELNRITRDLKEKIREEKEILLFNEKMRTAQEIHDILGHSLTLIISRLEGIRCIDDENERKACLKNINDLINSSIDELSDSFEEKRSSFYPSGILLSRQLKKLVYQCSTNDHRVDLLLKGTEPAVSSDIARNVYAVCREGITNSIRHGKARYMGLVLDFTNDINVVLFDNGNGCECIRENTGIQGMRRRIDQLGGNISFHSGKGEGFTFRAQVPADSANIPNY